MAKINVYLSMFVILSKINLNQQNWYTLHIIEFEYVILNYTQRFIILLLIIVCTELKILILCS